MKILKYCTVSSTVGHCNRTNFTSPHLISPRLSPLTSHLTSPYLNSSLHHISSHLTASLPTNVLYKIARCYPLTYGLSRPLQKSPSFTYTALPSFPHNPSLLPLLSSFSPLPLPHVPNPPTTPTYATSRRKRKRKVSGP